MKNEYLFKKISDLPIYIADGNYSAKYPKSDEFISSGVPFIRANNFKNNTIVDDGLYYISQKKHSVLKKGHLKTGDVLITTRGNIGTIAIVPKKFNDANINAQIVLLRTTDPSLDNKYLMWVFKSNAVKDQLQKLQTGTALKQLPIKKLLGVKIPIIPVVNQKRIVKILDKADSLHQKRKQAIELLDDYLKSKFLEMFGDPLKNPMGWEVKELGKICDVRDGTHDSPKYQADGFPLITSKNLKNDCIDFSEVNLVSEKDFLSINKRSFVGDGDILMPMIGTIGNPIIVKKDRDFAIKNVALIKFSKGIVNNIYIKNLLGSYFLDNYILKKSRGGTQKFLSLSDIRNIEVPIPDINMQTKFSKLVFETESLKQSMLVQSTELENQFQAFMQKAFKGEL